MTFKYYGPAFLWACFILIICVIPLGGVDKGPLFFAGFDKLVHCGLFFVLAVLYCAGSIRKWHTRTIRIEIAVKNTIVLISFGALIEAIQNYLPWRSADGADLFADTIGACMGIFSVIVTAYAVNHEKS